MSAPAPSVNEVIDKLSFTPPRNTKNRRVSYEPLAPPPAGPPPSPPPDSALKQALPASFSDDTSNGGGLSYQRQEPRRAPVPRVTHYDDKKKTGILSSFQGNANLRPNVGHRNSIEFGDALQEWLWKLRIMNLAGAALVVVLEIPVFLGHVVFLQPARAVLGVYLLALLLLLVLFELHTPFIATRIQDSLGLLYNPLGRALYLLLVAGLCVGQGFPVYIGGIWFTLSAIGILWAIIHYPDYRRTLWEQEEPSEYDLWKAAVSKTSKYSWARPDLPVGTADTGEDERQSLLSHG